MKVLRPVNVGLFRGYSKSHKGYDHSLKRDKNGKVVKDISKQDRNYCSSFHGVIVQSKNSETKNWTNNGKLTTKDYGNYCKIKAEVDGKTYYQLGAHFKQGSVLPVGTEIKAGQVVAQIGNTGNSTADHSHTEYRNEKNKNFPVTFVEKDESMQNDKESMQKQQIIDVYKATTGEYPNDDTINARLQENKNLVELIEDRLTGDTDVKKRWLEVWEIDPDTDQSETIEGYKNFSYRIREILRPLGFKMGSDTEEVLGKLSWLVGEYQKLSKEQTPKPRILVKGKDVEYVRIGEFIFGVMIGGGKNGTKKS